MFASVKNLRPSELLESTRFLSQARLGSLHEAIRQKQVDLHFIPHFCVLVYAFCGSGGKETVFRRPCSGDRVQETVFRRPCSGDVFRRPCSGDRVQETVFRRPCSGDRVCLITSLIAFDQTVAKSEHALRPSCDFIFVSDYDDCFTFTV